MQSIPTLPNPQVERMNAGFLKLHPSGKVVHVFTEATDTQFHDHPFSLHIDVVAGSYTEEVLCLHEDGGHHIEHFVRQAGTSHTILASTAHKITSLPDGFCVTQAQYGPNEKTPGFYDLTRPEGIMRRDWNQAEWRPLSA